MMVCCIQVPGGFIEDSCVLRGVMINKDVTHPRMKRMIKNPRIVLLDCSLEYKKGESQVIHPPHTHTHRQTEVVTLVCVCVLLVLMFVCGSAPCRQISRSVRRKTLPGSCRWRKSTSSRSVRTSSASNQTCSSPRRGSQVHVSCSSAERVECGAGAEHQDGEQTWRESPLRSMPETK